MVFIAFASFVAVAYGLDWIGRRLPARAWRAPVIVAGLAFVLVFGILDQVSPASIPDYASTQDRWESDDAFVQKIERVLHDGTSPLADRTTSAPAVFQLPYRYFPEAPNAGLFNHLGPSGNYLPKYKTIPFTRYHDRAFAQLEHEKLWKKVWQIACREEDIPEGGDRLE